MLQFRRDDRPQLLHQSQRPTRHHLQPGRALRLIAQTAKARPARGAEVRDQTLQVVHKRGREAALDEQRFDRVRCCREAFRRRHEHRVGRSQRIAKTLADPRLHAFHFDRFRHFGDLAARKAQSAGNQPALQRAIVEDAIPRTLLHQSGFEGRPGGRQAGEKHSLFRRERRKLGLFSEEMHTLSAVIAKSYIFVHRFLLSSSCGTRTDHRDPHYRLAIIDRALPDGALADSGLNVGSFSASNRHRPSTPAQPTAAGTSTSHVREFPDHSSRSRLRSHNFSTRFRHPLPARGWLGDRLDSSFREAADRGLVFLGSATVAGRGFPTPGKVIDNAAHPTPSFVHPVNTPTTIFPFRPSLENFTRTK